MGTNNSAKISEQGRIYSLDENDIIPVSSGGTRASITGDALKTIIKEEAKTVCVSTETTNKFLPATKIISVRFAFDSNIPYTNIANEVIRILKEELIGYVFVDGDKLHFRKQTVVTVNGVYLVKSQDETSITLTKLYNNEILNEVFVEENSLIGVWFSSYNGTSLDFDFIRPLNANKGDTIYLPDGESFSVKDKASKKGESTQIGSSFIAKLFDFITIRKYTNWTDNQLSEVIEEIQDSDGNPISRLSKFGQWKFWGKNSSTSIALHNKVRAIYALFYTVDDNGCLDLNSSNGTQKVHLDSNGVNIFSNEIQAPQATDDTHLVTLGQMNTADGSKVDKVTGKELWSENQVLSTILTGLSFISGTAVTSTDSILVAIGKLQKQFTNHKPWLSSGHTGTANKLMSTDANGNASETDALRTFAKQDNPTLYFPTPFYSTGTVTTSGINVTLTGGTFNDSHINQRIIINGEKREIVSRTSNSVIVISSALNVEATNAIYGIYQRFLYIDSSGNLCLESNNLTNKQFNLIGHNSGGTSSTILGTVYFYNEVLFQSGISTPGNADLYLSSKLIFAKGLFRLFSRQLESAKTSGNLEYDGAKTFLTDLNLIRRALATEDNFTSYQPTPFYSTGTVSVSGTTVTIVGGTFQSLLANNSKIRFSNGEERQITAYTDSTHVTIDRTTGGTISGATFAIYLKRLFDDGTKLRTIDNNGVVGDLAVGQIESATSQSTDKAPSSKLFSDTLYGGIVTKTGTTSLDGDLSTDFTNTAATGYLWTNKSMVSTVDAVVTGIEGVFSSGTRSIYVVNKEQTLLKKVYEFQATQGYNSKTVNIPLMKGEAILCDGLYYRIASGHGIKYKYSGLTIMSAEDDIVELSVKYHYNYNESLNLSSSIYGRLDTLEDKLNSIEDNYVILNSGVNDYSLSGVSKVSNTLVSNTANDYCYLNKIYHSDNRYIALDMTIQANSIVKFPIAYGGINSGEGASCFAIDLSEKKLIIYSCGNGLDTQYTSSGYTNTPLESVDLSDDDIIGTSFSVEIYKIGLLNKLVLINNTSGERSVVSHTGWGAGRQNQLYYIQNVQGSFIVTNSKVLSLCNPDIVFVGDSITEGVYVYDRMQRYAELVRQNNPNLKVVISARGGDTIDGVLSKFTTEYNIYKPKKMSVLIGANGGNTLEKLQLLKANCDAIGCELYLNHLTCELSNDGHIAKNAVVEQTGYVGARFDIATAKDYFPIVDGTHLSPRYKSSLYGDDGLHPNGDGNGKMYLRVLLDIPSILE